MNAINLTDLFASIGKAASQNGWDVGSLIDFMRQSDISTPDLEAVAIKAFFDE